jgi:hypothetical protein
MYAFGKVMGYDETFMDKLGHFVTFTSVFYLPYWLKATQGSNAAINDLVLYNDMSRLANIPAFTDMANSALRTINRHTWYLSQELVPFLLFGEADMNSNRSEFVKKLLTFPVPDQFTPGKPFLPVIKLGNKITDFIGPNSWVFFSNLDINVNFLVKDVAEWDTDPDFIKAADYVRHVKVVNDAAERGVKLCSDYLKILSKDEAIRQNILQVVEEHRKLNPSRNKRELFRPL